MPNQYIAYITPGDTNGDPTGHRRDAAGTPTSNGTPTAGTENTIESQKHYRRNTESQKCTESYRTI